MKLLPTTFILLLVTAAMCGQSRSSLSNRTHLSGPTDVIVGPNGDVYVIESDICLVRKIAAKTRRITTVAGNGKNDYAGDGGLATNAALGYPTAIAIDVFGNLYIAEISGRVRKVDGNTQIIATIAGNGKMDDGGTGDGGLALAASFRRVEDLAFDDSGDLYVVDDMDHRVRKIATATQKISTVAGGNWISIAAEPATGDVLGDGRSARTAALYFPSGIAFDGKDNMYLADFQNHRIRRVDKWTGVISTVAGLGIPKSNGNGGLAARSAVSYPRDLAIDKVGNIFFVDSSGVRRIDSLTGRISMISKKAGSIALNGESLYISCFGENRIYEMNLRTRRLTVFAGNGRSKRHVMIL